MTIDKGEKVTLPSNLQPHQDPRAPGVTPNEVSILEYITTVMAGLDRRFADLHQDLKTDIDHRIEALKEDYDHRLGAADARYQQRYQQQEAALNAALAAAKEASIKVELASDKRFECVAIETLILLADGTTKSVGQLVVGDKIQDEIGYTIVTSNDLGAEELFEVQTSTGIVRCTARHPWYARPDTDSAYRWVETQHLSPGWLLWRIE